MTEPRWLDLRAVLLIHDEQIAEHGGGGGVRDASLLDSGLTRARNADAYGEEDIFALAGLCAAGVIRNHPFVDGNKRTGFICAAVFLELNGYRLVAPEAEAATMTLALASDDIDAVAYAQWLRASVEPMAT